MVKIYADLIIAGLKTINDVPTASGLRDKVKQRLIEMGYEELAQETK